MSHICQLTYTFEETEMIPTLIFPTGIYIISTRELVQTQTTIYSIVLGL